MSYKIHQVDVKIEVCVEVIILKASESLVVCTVEVSDLPNGRNRETSTQLEIT